MEVKIKKLNNDPQDKRASVSIGDKNIKFGYSKAKSTYYDGATNQKRDAYISRHQVREDWTDPFTAGFWSRWVLWEHRHNEKSKIIKSIKKNSRIPLGKIAIELPKLIRI